MKFISGLWQIHAFGEGNTRTIAVFAIKYLCTLGFEVGNDMFAKHSWYFRNALVRANFNDYQDKIHATQKYLNYSFGNLLLEENNELKNRNLRVDVGEKPSDVGEMSEKPQTNVGESKTYFGVDSRRTVAHQVKQLQYHRHYSQ